MAIYFYHLTRSPLERALPALLTRALAAGWRVALRAPEDRLEELDDMLWRVPEEEFVPHGREGTGRDDRNPVLLTTGGPEARECLLAACGAPVEPGEVAGLERAMLVFDGRDMDELGAARQRWKDMTAAGVEAQYWSEETGKWALKASSGGAD